MKKKLVSALALVMACVLLVACSKGGGEKQDNASGDVSEAISDSSVTEDSADKGTAEETSEGSIVEDFEFTKTASEEKLEKPITACGLSYDENEDRKYENMLDQERENIHLHIGILSMGYEMDSYLATSQADNAQYATSVARGYHIQQADATNADGSAKFTMIRYTNFEDGGENDYQYMGDLVYTDGTSVAGTEFIYSIDKEYGNGEEVEAAMKAITGYYGIDYSRLDWVDVKNQAE